MLSHFDSGFRNTVQYIPSIAASIPIYFIQEYIFGSGPPFVYFPTYLRWRLSIFTQLEVHPIFISRMTGRRVDVVWTSMILRKGNLDVD